ncbi:hypothetical protein TNCV_1739511 [Trichonephila clavipes]|nr:hypothetical protein TNCV_1739511 [Trichonephila clavipes]
MITEVGYKNPSFSRSRKREKTASIVVSVLVVPSLASVFIVKFSENFKNLMSGFDSSEAKLTLKSSIKIIGFLSSSDPMIAATSDLYSTKTLWMKVITAAIGLPRDT